MGVETKGDGGQSLVTYLIVAFQIGCLVLGYFVLCVVRWYLKILRIGREVDKLPGDKTDRIWGNLRQHPGLCAATLPWIVDLTKRHGGYVYRLWFGPFRPAVALNHPDTVKLILRTAEPKAVRGNGAYSLVLPFLGDGLLISSGEKWFRNRKFLTPAFHFDVLKPYFPIYNRAAEVLINKWQRQLNEKGQDKSIEIFSSVSLCTLDILLSCAFSYNDNVQETSTDDAYVKHVLSLSQMIMQRALKIHWYIDWFYYKTDHGKTFAAKCDYVHQIADKVIAQRKKALERDLDVAKKRHNDFLDILLLARDENGKGLSDVEMRNEVNTFLFAGHDTTASAISWCLYNLASHPDIQRKARLEVDALVQGRDTNAITWEDVNQMPYLLMCIKESLRSHPPVPFIVRELETPLKVNDVTLLPGTIIDINIYSVHHNELVWGADHMNSEVNSEALTAQVSATTSKQDSLQVFPKKGKKKGEKDYHAPMDEYKPERFESEEARKMDSYAFIPFSAGPRNCIGQVFALNEIRVVVARILLKYELEVDKTHLVEMMPEITLRAKNGIKLHLTPRD